MSGFLLYIATAFALIFIIEGLIYALFPGGVRKMMAYAVSLDPGKLRYYGAIMATTGFCILWILQAVEGG